MKDGGCKDIGCPHIEEPHDEGRKECQNRIYVAIEDELGHMHNGKKQADSNYSHDVIAQSFLHKPPEIDLFGKCYANKLKNKGVCRKEGERPVM